MRKQGKGSHPDSKRGTGQMPHHASSPIPGEARTRNLPLAKGGLYLLSYKALTAISAHRGACLWSSLR